MASRLAAFRAALEAGDAGVHLPEHTASELCRALACAVAITERDDSGAIAVLAQAAPDGWNGPRDDGLLASAAERLSRRAHALSLHTDGRGAPSGIHYLGIPAPRRSGSRYAIHLFSRAPLSPSQRRTARTAADWLGAWGPEVVAGEAAGAASPSIAREAGAALNGVAIEQLLSDAMRAAAETLGADTCSLMVTDEGRAELVVDAAYGLDAGILRDPEARASRGVASYIMASGQPVILGDPAQDPRLEGLEIEPRRNIRCSICVPIALRDGLRGVVSFNRTNNPEPFTQADLRLASSVAAQLGPCVANARLYQHAAKLLGGMTAIALDNAVAQRRLRQDLDTLYRLYDAVQRVNMSLDPRDIIEQTVQGVALLTGCRTAGFAALEGWAEVGAGPAASGAAADDTLALTLSPGAAEAAKKIAGVQLIEDLRQASSSGASPLAAELAQQIGGNAALLVPCADGQSSLGLIVGWGLARAPEERELSLAAGLAAHAAALLRKVSDYQAAVSRRSLELSALYQLCGEISAATSFESALRSVLEIAHSMVRYDEGLVFIWNEEASRLELAACRGADFNAVRAQVPQDQPGNMYQWVFAESKAFISTDIGHHAPDAVRRQVLRSSMAVPLVVGNETIGVLAVHSALAQAYTEEHVKVLSIVASQAAAIYRALQSLGRLSRYTDKILQSVVAGVIGLDRAGRVVIWSPAAARIFGRSAAEAVGAELAALVRAMGRDWGGAGGDGIESLGLIARRVLARGEAVLDHELRLERDGQPPRALRADCTPLLDADAQLVGAVLLIEDITERKRMQDRMRQMSQLAAVGHLAANVAHEIRNSLSAIKTAAQFLHTEYGAEATIAQFSGIIDDECDRLSKVASDFLTFARPSEPALELISLASVIDAAVAATAPEMAERSLRLHWRRPPGRLPRVWADADAIRQAFINLLINAAQAVGANGEVRIALATLRADAGGLAVEAAISDTGPGIAESDLERIWAPFFSTKAKGTGLGLSIVRKIVESHGGQVWAESGQGGGATFRLRLPLERPNLVPAATEAAAPAASGPRWRQAGLFDRPAATGASENDPRAAAPQGASR